jgi:hypothetical protein
MDKYPLDLFSDLLLNITSMYILSKKVLIAIEDARPAIISKLALALHCSDASINRHVRENNEDGDLTKTVALDLFLEEFGLEKKDVLKKISEPVTG